MPARIQGTGIRLSDVADHLVGVEEVVDRDEVEACGEFQPEGRLGDGAEQQYGQDQREPDEAKESMRARPRQRLGNAAS